MLSTTKHKKIKGIVYKIAAIVFWLLLWQIVAMIINREIFLASPLSVISAFFKLVVTQNYWLSIANSFLRIFSGFLIALVLGVLLSVAAHKSKIVKELLSPVMSFLNAAPVASFIMILLIMLRNRANLALVIALMMVLPIIYTNMLTGFENVDKKLLEMAKVFKVKPKKKILYIYISNLMPHFMSACKIALGMCWKAGVAAEVIGLVSNTIGENMFLEKQFLRMDYLFAWTFTVIALSAIFEFLFLRLVKAIKNKIEMG